VVVATAGDVPTDADLAARIAALDERFGGTLSFAEVLRLRR
jgi:hypothetical protein